MQQVSHPSLRKKKVEAPIPESLTKDGLHTTVFNKRWTPFYKHRQ